ncbi:MAG: glycosyltransferase family 39 protein [Taibaiella sp.]|nr:glycosyltransferase family 39 protein [Taibaiella sp.]
MLFILLAVFLFLKLPHLHYPFYWDESWSYAPAIELMYKHGPSLMPNAIDIFYSRGHPLLFYAAAGAWMRVFGDSHVSQHSFALFLSALLIVSVYEVSRKVFDRRVALFAAGMLCVQVMFFVQATFLLPEIMVSLFVLLSLYFYYAKKPVATFICCTALLLTKESGLVLGLILGIHSFLYLVLNKKEIFVVRLKMFCSLLLSGIAIGIFYIIQKKINGWYLFPEHMGMIGHSIYGKFTNYLELLFYNNNRYLVYQVLLLLSLTTAIRFQNVWYAASLLPGIAFYVLFANKLPSLPAAVLGAFVLIALGIGAAMFIRLNKDGKADRFLYPTLYFLAAYLCFSCINFFTGRYVMCAMVLLLILTAWYFVRLVDRWPSAMYYGLLGVVILIGLYGFRRDTNLEDTNLGAFNGMRVEEGLVDYMEAHHLYDKNIAASSFQEREHFQKPYTGFLHSNVVFTHVKVQIDSATDYIVFDNIEPDTRYESIEHNTAYKRVYRVSNGNAWGEIYMRKQ